MTIREHLEAIRQRCAPIPGATAAELQAHEHAVAALAQIKTVYYCPDCNQHSENLSDFEDDCAVEAYLLARLPDPVAAATPPEQECDHVFVPAGLECKNCGASPSLPSPPSGT